MECNEEKKAPQSLQCPRCCGSVPPGATIGARGRGRWAHGCCKCTNNKSPIRRRSSSSGSRRCKEMHTAHCNLRPCMADLMQQHYRKIVPVPALWDFSSQWKRRKKILSCVNTFFPLAPPRTYASKPNSPAPSLSSALSNVAPMPPRRRINWAGISSRCILNPG